MHVGRWLRAAVFSCSVLLMAVGSAALISATSAQAQGDGKVPDWTGRDAKAESSPGAQVYRSTCAACHDAGVGRAPQLVLLHDMTPESIVHALTAGAMQPQGSALTAEQRVAVAEYISGRPVGANSAGQALRMCKGAAARFDMAAPPALAGWGLDAASTHSIPAAVSGLSMQNVSRLKLKWAFGFPNSSRARSQPALAGGAIIVGNHNGTVYALDNATGCVRWAYPAAAEVRTGIVVSPWRKGDRAARPLVYFGDVSGDVYAVNLRDGRLAWKVTADAHPAAILTGTPTLFNGMLYVPVSSNEEAFATSPGYACCDFRGSVVALDALSGREKWRTWLVDPAKSLGASKDGPDKRGPSGVSVWNSPAIDAKRGQLIVATSDNYSLPATDMSDSIVALDLATGRIKWHHQALAGDAWNVACVIKTSASCPDEAAPDFDFGAGTVFARGRDGRDYVLAGQKSGWVYALDPDNGKPVWQKRVGRGSPSGGVHFGMAADNGILFVPMSDRFAIGPDSFPLRPGLYALDIATGNYVWEAPDSTQCNGSLMCLAGYGGSVTATNGLVLIGSDLGQLRVYDAATGKVLWQDNTARDFATVNGVAAKGGSISGGVAPLAYKGRLIVPSGYGFASKLPGNVLLVYGVD